MSERAFIYTQGGVIRMNKDGKDEYVGLGRNEVRTILRKKGRLTLGEAALFLGYAPRTLHNLNQLVRTKKDPTLAPRGMKKGAGRGARLEYLVTDLEQWEKSRQEIIGA